MSPVVVIPTNRAFLPLPLIFHVAFHSLLTYVAYDAACPVEASRNVSVEVREDGLGTAECPKCHTQYNLSSGGFPTGEGTEYLKHYKVTVSGTSLQVRN